MAELVDALDLGSSGLCHGGSSPSTRTNSCFKSPYFMGFFRLLLPKLLRLELYKYLKQKLSRKLYCNKLKNNIKISECGNCKYKEFLIWSNSI